MTTAPTVDAERGRAGVPLAVVGAAWFVGYVVLLITVPYAVPVASDVASAAALAGYNNAAAFPAVLAWSALGIAAAFLVARRNPPAAMGQDGHPAAAVAPRRRVVECLVVGLAAAALYFPWFLARHGPYLEDGLVITDLHRMNDGQAPYADFEFLYGPLMLYPAHWWRHAFGFSMTSFYGYLAVLEGLTFAGLMALLQRFLPGTRRRYVAFAIVAAIALNTTLGVNYNAVRRMGSLLVLLLIAHRPRDPRAIGVGGVALGVLIAYSHDYGIASLASALALYGYMGLRRRSLADFARGAAFAGVTAATWYTVARAVLGGDFAAYLECTRFLVERFSAGEASFEFYWTANSLSAFGLLTLGGLALGSGLGRARDVPLTSGDRVLLAWTAFALVALKSGLNRCDFWHLSPPFVGLVLVHLLRLPTNVFTLPRSFRRLGLSLTVVFAATYLFGGLPTGSAFLNGWARGLRDVVAGVPRVEPTVQTRTATIEWERSHPDPDVVALAAYLAAEERRDRPVLFWSYLWGLAKRVGVEKTDYMNDEFIYADSRGRDLCEWLEERPDALVLIYRPMYERLYGLAPPGEYPEFRMAYAPTVTKSLAAWLTSVHYRGVELEMRARDERLTRTAGGFLRERFRYEAEFGDVIVLAPKGE